MKLRRFFCLVCVVLVIVFVMQFYFVGMLSRGRLSTHNEKPQTHVPDHHDLTFSESSRKEVKKENVDPLPFKTIPPQEVVKRVKETKKPVIVETPPPPPPKEKTPPPPKEETRPQLVKETPPPPPPTREENQKKEPTDFVHSVNYVSDGSGLPFLHDKSDPCRKYEDWTDWEKEILKRKKKIWEDYDYRYIFKGIYGDYAETLKSLTGQLEKGQEIDELAVAKMTFAMLDQLQGLLALLTNVTIDPIPLFTSMLQTASDQFNDETVPDKNIFISYGDNCCYTSLPNNIRSALQVGKFDEAFGLTGKNLSARYKERNAQVLGNARGGGYWAWKSRSVLDTMVRYPMSKNVLIFYGDAGMYWTEDARPMLNRIRLGKRDVNIFSMAYEEREWTKRDSFVIMGLDREEYYTYPTAHGGQNCYRNTLFGRWFVSMWSYYMHDYRIVSDSPNVMGKPNLEGHRAHRHDQSILGLLVKKFNIGFDEYGYNFPIPKVLVLSRNKS